MKPRVLFIPMSWGRGLGPLTGSLSIAQQLRQCCEIAFVCRDRFTDLIQRADYPWYEIVSPPERREVDSPEFYTDFPFFQGIGNESLVRQMISDERESILDFRPDAVFAWLQFTAAITAPSLGVPLASKANWPEHPRFFPPDFSVPLQPSKVTPLFNELLIEHNSAPADTIWELSFLRSDLKLAPTIPEFEPELKSVPNLHYVGHLVHSELELVIQPDWLSKLDESRPTVFVYLSAKQFNVQDYTHALAHLFEGTEFQVVVALGSRIQSAQIPSSTANVRFVGLVPADEMLSKSDAFISIGTRGTSWNALLHATPMVLFPGVDVETGLNARNIEKHGAGVRLPDEALFTEKLVDTVRTVLRPTYRERALMLGKRMRSFGGPRRAASHIEQLAKDSSI